MEPNDLYVCRILTLVFAILFIAAACAPAMNLAAPTPTISIDDANLTAIARDTAHQIGLQGQPTATRGFRLSLGDWAALNGMAVESSPQFGISPDKPVFVFVAQGKIISQTPGGVRPDGTKQTDFQALAVVLDVQTAQVIQTFTYPDLTQMPVAMTGPIVIPPTPDRGPLLRTPYRPPSITPNAAATPASSVTTPTLPGSRLYP